MNVESGKKDIIIEYEADDDALPHEHERRHKEIVEQLLGKGVLQPGDAGDVKVERVKPAPARSRESQGPEGQAEAAKG
jgi:hypothetical protein